MGYIFLIPIMYMFMNMMDSFNQYKIKETCDVYLLCERVGDLENAVSNLTKLVERVKDLDKEYVESFRYNKDHLELRDDITINKNDIIELKGEVKKKKNKDTIRTFHPQKL
jgi:hypothetical protein